MGPDFRVVQLVPPGSACAIAIGVGIAGHHDAARHGTVLAGAQLGDGTTLTPLAYLWSTREEEECWSLPYWGRSVAYWLPDYALSAAPPLASDLFASWYYDELNQYNGASAAAQRVLRGIENGGNLEYELQKLRR